MNNLLCQATLRIACRTLLALFVLIGGFETLSPAWSYEGEEIPVHGGRGGGNRTVHLTLKQQNMLGLSLASVSYRRMEQALNLNGTVEWLPDRQSDVTLRISGQIAAVYVNLGDQVHRGQPMIKVESRLIGNPPPSVVISAPLGGVVDARNVVLGQSVEPNTVLFHIGDPASMLVVARVYEEDLGKVRIGQIAEIRVIGYPEEVFRGQVTLIGPTLDPLNRTGSVWIKLANPKGVLKPNEFVRVRLILKQVKKALAIPDDAVLVANGEKFVFVKVGPDSYRRVLIKTGIEDNGYMEILSGLTPKERVVTTGNREIFTIWLGNGSLKGEE